MHYSAPPSGKKYLLYVVAQDSYFLSHRLPMARAAEQAGFTVLVAAPLGKCCQAIQDAGYTFITLKYLSRSGLSLVKQIKAVWELIKLYKTWQPIVVHHVALKPVIYGSIAGLFNPHLFVVNALGGLGYVFISPSIKAYLIRLTIKILSRCLFNRRNTILVLQNLDDQRTLIKAGIVKSDKTVIIPGSGVNIDFYKNTPLPPYDDAGPIVAYVGRMLWDKGIGELVEASRILKQRGIRIQCNLYGDIDPENPASISFKQMKSWQEQGIITWCGPTQNSLIAYQNCHIAVLPSYREGLPKSLLEAASCGRPIVTTDVPGCRDVVKHAITGLVVAVKSPESLADAIQSLVNDPDLCQKMGRQGRLYVMNNFADHNITRATAQLYSAL